MSLKVALEKLGFDPCYHMTEVFAHPEHTGFWISAWRGEPADWEGVLGEYEAAVDWPACTFYEELMERHPDARVILSVRDPGRWYESVRNTIYELSVVIPRHPLYRIGYTLVSLLVFRGSRRFNLADEIIWQGTFDGRFEERAYAIEVFERHNAEVRQHVPADRLLVYRRKGGLGTPVRVPRGRRTGRTVPPHERHGRDAAQGAGNKGRLHRRARDPDAPSRARAPARRAGAAVSPPTARGPRSSARVARR